MATWPLNPDWTEVTNINNGNEYVGGDGLVFSHLNAIVNNLTYLKNNAGGDLNLVNSTGKGSLVQLTYHSDDITPYNNTANGSGAVSFGKNVTSDGNSAFTTGQDNNGKAAGAFTGGIGNTTNRPYGVTLGRFAAEAKVDGGNYNYLLQLGNGISNTNRKDAFGVRYVNNNDPSIGDDTYAYGDKVNENDPKSLTTLEWIQNNTASKLSNAEQNYKAYCIYANTPELIKLNQNQQAWTIPLRNGDGRVQDFEYRYHKPIYKHFLTGTFPMVVLSKRISLAYSSLSVIKSDIITGGVVGMYRVPVSGNNDIQQILAINGNTVYYGETSIEYTISSDTVVEL